MSDRYRPSVHGFDSVIISKMSHGKRPSVSELDVAIRNHIRRPNLPNENAILAALWKYHKQQSPDDLRIIKCGNALMSAEDRAQLLIPGRSDVRVRAYLRGIPVGRNPRSIDGEAQQDAQLLLSALDLVSWGDSDDEFWFSTLHPLFQYALARAYLASGCSKDTLQAKELLLRVLETFVWANDRASRAGADLRLPMQCSLVQAWHMLGEVHKAKDLLEEMVHERVASDGESHAQVLDLRLALAAAYGMEGQIPKALTLLQEVSQLQEGKDGADHRLLLVTLHPVLSFHVRAKRDAEVNTTLSFMNELLKHNDVHPAQQTLLQPHGQRNTVGSSGHALNESGSLQRLLDHMINNLPSDVNMPPDLQRRIATYKEGMPARSGLKASEVTASGNAAPSEGSGLSIQRPLPSSKVSASASASAASNGLVVASAAGAASISAPIAIGAAALTASGAIGMAVAALYKILVIDFATVKALNKANEIGEKKNQIEEGKNRLEENKQHADSPASFQAMLAFINGMAMAEEEVARKENDFEKLKEINKRRAADLADLRSKYEKMQDAARERLSQAEKASGTVISQANNNIERLEKEVQRLQSELNQKEQKPTQSFISQDIEMVEPEQSRVKREQEMKEALKSSLQKNEAAQKLISDLQAKLGSAPGKVDSLQSKIDVSEESLADGAENNTCEMCKELHSANQGLRDSLAEMQRGRDELLKRVSDCRCGDEPEDSGEPQNNASSVCERSRSAIDNLRAELTLKDFGVHEKDFLDGLDPAGELDEMVQILCGRLGGFILTLHQELIPYYEEQKTSLSLVRKEKRELEAELHEARKMILDLRIRLFKASDKASRTQDELSETQRRLVEASEVSSERAQPAVQQDGRPEREPSWWQSVMPGWSTKK